MSVDIQWETLTTGPDGARLAETVRAFIHDKFQQVTLPRFIRSVHVHSFDFGSVSPEIELKDICDPLPDFYADEDDDGEDADANAVGNGDDEERTSDDARQATTDGSPARALNNRHKHHDKNSEQISCEDPTQHFEQKRRPQIDTKPTGIRRSLNLAADRPASPFFPHSPAPGIPGGTSNLNYFHLPFGPGLSGSSTPLAAVAGAHFPSGWPDNAGNIRPKPAANTNTHQSQTSGSPNTSTSAADPTSRPPSQHQHDHVGTDFGGDMDRPASPSGLSDSSHSHVLERDANDIQIVAHVKYSGDLRLSLTAEILLDYPMPSFVGIPLQLNITGVSFDGVAILAYIKKRAHVCFLSPEDAEGFLDQADDSDEQGNPPAARTGRMGGLLEEIRVESEIGQKENGKQVLKNVGKVEKFVLEQVRRIFEDEFVFPSFWTLLV